MRYYLQIAVHARLIAGLVETAEFKKRHFDAPSVGGETKLDLSASIYFISLGYSIRPASSGTKRRGNTIFSHGGSGEAQRLGLEALFHSRRHGRLLIVGSDLDLLQSFSAGVTRQVIAEISGGST